MRLLVWPLWIRCLLGGLVFGLGMWALVPQAPRTALAAFASLGAGLAFGALMLITVGAQERRMFHGHPPLTGQERLAVARAVSAGTPPGDDRLRAAGDRLAHRLAHPRLGSRGQAVVFGLFLLLSLKLAVTTTPWFWLGVVFGVAVIAFEIPGERRRRSAAQRYLHAAAEQRAG